MDLLRRSTLVLLGVAVLAAGPFALSGSATAAFQEELTQEEIVQRVTVVGNQRYGADQLVQALGVRVGRPLEQEVVQRGVRVLFETFKVRAEVQKRPLPPEEGGGIELRLVIEELPVDLEPRFVGNVDIETKKLLEWAELREREELFLYQAPSIRGRLIRRYREEGYYFVEVNVVERPGGTDEATGEFLAPDVIFEIKEGPKVRVKDVVLEGNESFPDHRFLLLFRRGLKKLAEVELGKPGWFGLFPDAFDSRELDADIVAMREVYRDFGYLDAIVELDRLEFSQDRSWVTPHVAIDEGGLYTVGSLRIEGVEIVPGPQGRQELPQELFFEEQELLSLLELTEGDTYERRVHAEDGRTLRRFYGGRGYISHPTLNEADSWSFLEPRLTFEADRPVVHVTYRIAQGRQIFIREIPIVGNVHTQDRVIRRMITVRPGDIADPESIERSRQRIEATGWFSDQFDINHREPEIRFKDTDDPSWKDLEFLVEEGQVLTFNLAGGVSSNNGAFGTISLTMQNFDATNLPTSLRATIDDVATRRAFHGGGQRLRIRAQPGTEYSFFDVLFSEPDLFGLHEDRISASLSASKNLRIYRSHDERRSALGLRLGRSLRVDDAVYLGVELETVEVSDVSTGGEPGFVDPFTVPVDLKAQEGELDLSHFVLGYRYSSIDNGLNTRNGIEIDFENSIYTEALGSDAEFVKSELSFDWWNEFDDDPELVSPYCHFQIAGGVGVPFGDTDEVPYTERYFLGGLSTLRGYRYRGVGPNENDFPIGGQTMLHGTLEYRFPLVKQVQPGTYREYESIQGGFFVDWGVLDPDDFSFDTREIRATAGFLFGFSVPLPITFSFGWPVRDGEGDVERVFAFNIGI